MLVGLVLMDELQASVQALVKQGLQVLLATVWDLKKTVHRCDSNEGDVSSSITGKSWIFRDAT